VTARKLYLQAAGGLSFAAPVAGGAAAAAPQVAGDVADPHTPVPYSKRPIMGVWTGLKGSRERRFQRAGVLWKVEDQRFVHDRPDVLSFVTAPLTEDLEVTGRILARLFASTTGTDADWVVKLIDVYPEAYPERPEMGGYQLMIADDVLRGRFRKGFTEAVPLVPGKIEEFVIDLRTRNHMFRAGHRIMVQVQSSWFPLIDRNPQTFVDIPKAKESDFKRAEQRIWCSAAHPSHIELSVVGG
jgi:putative CocE/NonD family hydrolase